MSLFWEPKWVRKLLKFEGIEIVTCEDLSSGLIVCPICEDIDELCPEGKTTSRVKENMLTFFTPKDLILHIKTHKRGKRPRFKLERPEEVEEEEEEE